MKTVPLTNSAFIRNEIDIKVIVSKTLANEWGVDKTCRNNEHAGSYLLHLNFLLLRFIYFEETHPNTSKDDGFYSL